MTQSIPQELFRGDQAKRLCCSPKKRSLMVDQYQVIGLFTNLICQGNPLSVVREGITQTVSRHISGWQQSHYLSFSEDRDIAELFAKGITDKNLELTNDTNWDSVIFTFDTSLCNWQKQSPGIFIGTKNIQEPAYFKGITKLAIIDCVTLLSNLVTHGQSQFQDELNSAKVHKEWLLIPLDPLNPNTPHSHIGYSANLQPILISGEHYKLG